MRAGIVGVVLLLLASAGAGAATPAERTFRLSERDADPVTTGDSANPTIDRAATTVAFDSAATDLAGDGNGAVRDVLRRDLATGVIALVSVAHDGGPADGPSDSPVIASRERRRIVFSSRATNLVPGDGNGVRDVFATADDGRIVRVSVGADGAEANGASFQADVSGDGRRVVFTSFASNLVPGDTNGVEDVFVRDLVTQRTTRVSQRAGRSLSGRSRAPAISDDGSKVSFESTAADAVDRDTNRVADVFVADVEDGDLLRVSVSSRERQQNRAVQPPFVTVSDLSHDGRFVVWDSDATNLVRGDRNRDTDVFLRDTRTGRTRLVSRAANRRQGDNDSYMPRISEGGRFVTFSSFAGNLWPVDRAGEDLFLHDRARGVTLPLTVRARGGIRGREARRQLLRRAAVSDHGRDAVFSSTARLVSDERGGHEDVYLRRLLPAPDSRIARAPRVGRGDRGRARYVLAATTPEAVFVCQIDGGRPYFCPRRGRLPRLARGRHRLAVRAGGPGILFERSRSFVEFRIR